MPKIIWVSWPTGTRSGVAGSSIARAMANATTSGPGGPDGPVVLVSTPAHCSAVATGVGSSFDAFQEHSEVFESQITHLDYESRSSRIPRLIKRNSRDVELFGKRAAMH